MRKPARLAIGLALLGLAAVGVAAAQTAPQPRVTNAQMETRPAAAGLEKEFRAIVSSHAASAWIGYSAPLIPGEHQMCCYSSVDNWNGSACCGICRLEGKTDGGVNMQSEPVKLEGPRNMFVLFRIEQGRVQKIRSFSEDCQIDAGGVPFIWLTDARPAESVALLTSFVVNGDLDTKEGERTSHSALSAIALHGDASADRALESFVAPNQPESLRRNTAFWLGSARGKRGYELLRRMAQDDLSEHVRNQVTFALSVSREPEALPELIRMAKSDSSTRVRGQALFWLAQKAGKKAAGTITEAIESDPDTDVKKRAVFALSQLPKDEGVLLLIQVARSNRNPVVRKQAMFWLGQSNDPRALAFIEEVLAH